MRPAFPFLLMALLATPVCAVKPGPPQAQDNLGPQEADKAVSLPAMRSSGQSAGFGDGSVAPAPPDAAAKDGFGQVKTDRNRIGSGNLGGGFGDGSVLPAVQTPGAIQPATSNAGGGSLPAVQTTGTGGMGDGSALPAVQRPPGPIILPAVQAPGADVQIKPGPPTNPGAGTALLPAVQTPGAVPPQPAGGLGGGMMRR